MSDVGFTQQLSIYETFRDYAKHEDTLTNNRLNWILSIHGFLYAAYAFTLQKKIEVAQKISADAISVACISQKLSFADCHRATETMINLYYSSPRYFATAMQVDLLLVFIAFVGFLISFFGLRSIRAANIALASLQRIFEAQYTPDTYAQSDKAIVFEETSGKKLYLPTIAGGGMNSAHFGGQVESAWVPYVLMGSWVLAFFVEAVTSLVYLSA